MLVLSRKPGERILIGNDVKITVIRIGPNSVRIGIDAPGHLNIVREELCINGDPNTAPGLQPPAGAQAPNLPRERR
jgi:carbon storage regulator